MAMLAIAGSLGFTSCSDDNKDEPNGAGNGGENQAVVANPSNVFTAGIPTKVGGMSVNTDANGLVTSMGNATDGVNITFTYPSLSRADGYDVIMQVEEDGDRNIFNLSLNELGFTKYCRQIESDGNVEEWWFEYNADGQLSKMTRSEGDNEVTSITYVNGNITKVVGGGNDPDSTNDYTISYGSPLIENKGCIMLFDATFGIDMDEMEYAYFAGLLGKATKNLPIERIDSVDGDRGTYTWTLDSNGMPVKVEIVESGDGWSDSDTMEFNW